MALVLFLTRPEMVLSGTHTHLSVGFCSVLFGWDLQDRMYFEKTEFNDEEGGFGDMICKVDLKSFRRIPWENNTPFFLVDVYHPRTKEPIFCSPRGLVRDAEKGFQQELGCTPFIGIELEFFCFKGKKALRGCFMYKV